MILVVLVLIAFLIPYVVGTIITSVCRLNLTGSRIKITFMTMLIGFLITWLIAFIGYWGIYIFISCFPLIAIATLIIIFVKYMKR